ncbi:auxilin-related protein 2-like [Salvia splendens]|uniref:auxilin-related protein 2-like n=1 Tax=Salvia splendens TaxID=180675 RepID=UPI001C2772E1|nr:auxilin-related protein 2-like [Salvia splendens]XP_042045237.1 auxilin-related protein 2-like [Salvia splendens]
MDDLDIMARDFGFGKSKPMRSAQFSEVFGEPAKFTPSSQHSSMGEIDYNSMFTSEANNSSSRKTTSSAPVYDKPVYDDDIFEGLPGLKSSSPTSAVRFDNDVFAGNQNRDYNHLLGNFGRSEQAKENKNIVGNGAKSKSNSSSKGYDDLLAGFGSAPSAASNRTESDLLSVPVGGSKHGSARDETVSAQDCSSSRVFSDPLEEISKHGKSSKTRAEASSGGSRGFEDLNPLNSFGKPAQSFSRGKDTGGKEGSPSRSASPQFVSTREKIGSSSSRYSESNMETKSPLDNFQEPPLFDMPKFSTDFQKSFDQTAQYFETSSHIDASPPSSGLGQQSDVVWLTVSEIPLFTQPTAAPPPSRPPPPIPHHKLRAETVSSYSSSKKKGGKFPSPPNHRQYSQSPKTSRPVTKGQQLSQFGELDDFAQGGSQNGLDGSVNIHSTEDTNAFSAAADASAAAMKEAMEKAEAKFRHAKEVREREYAKTARYKESVQLEKDEQDSQERNLRDINDILERERKQKEEEEREKIRLQRERERSMEIEREKGRQAVERANREARGRAAVHAREKQAAEAHLRAEKAAVEKVSAEARGRAEKVAVQRVQAEARERAAAVARGRAEKAAAEARERATAAETKDKELREKAFAVRAEVEARRRAERAAVDRAATEARERAAAAASATMMNQQRNDDDLESIFGMGRANSAPKARENSTNPFSSQQYQNKGGAQSGKRTSSNGASSNIKKVSSTSNIVDDLSSVFGAPSAGEFQEVGGETEERRQARLERHQRTQERAAKAVAEKNQRDLQAQMEQEERHRMAATLDIEIKRWAAGKEGNLRALLSSLQYVLWPECGWQPVSLTDLIVGASVKKAYRKATLCIHPDKMQQKGATLQQKYITEKVFDLLKEAWNKFNSEELF